MSFCVNWEKASNFSYKRFKNPRKVEIIPAKEKQLKKLDRIFTLAVAGAVVICIAFVSYLTIVMAEVEMGETKEFSNFKFTSKLFDVLKTTSGNVFFSPYSLQVALAMTYSGSTGNTAKQLQKCLGFSENKDALYKAVADSTASLKSSNKVAMNVANGIFVQQDYSIKDSFTKTLNTVFAAEAKALDFANKSDAAKHINGYVSSNTNNKIKDLFSPDAFSEMTKLVLVNAIYFKGNWVNKFDPAQTFKGDFHLNSKQKNQVDFMKINRKFNVLESDELKATVVVLPYEGDFSMVIVVPNEIEGIKHVEATLSKINLEELSRDTFPREVQLSMPKFKLEQKLELVDPLKQMGVSDMFDSKTANFSGISDKKDLYVSQVVQKAFIEVNEEGSEAAAATGIQIMAFSLPLPPTPLVVDRPFVFYVNHVPSGTPLFFGRVSEIR